MNKTNLSRAMACFNLSEDMLSTELRLDRAQINRWKNGRRTLKWNSLHTQKIVRLLLRLPFPGGRDALMEMISVETNWQGDADSLQDELAAWICRPIDPLDDSGIADALHSTSGLTAKNILWPKHDEQPPNTPYGHMKWEAMLRHIAFSLRHGTSQELRIFVHFYGGVLPMGAHFYDFFRYFMGDDGLRAKVLIASDGRKSSMNALLSQWIPVLSKGNITLLNTREHPTIRNTVFELEGESGVYCLLQPIENAEPTCLYINDGNQSLYIRRELESLLGRAAPLLIMLRDRDLSFIERIFYEEFAEPDGYDILKSGINTMFMAHEDFTAFLKRKGYAPSIVENCTNRFIQFQQAMRTRIQESPVRELLDVRVIEEMVKHGRYVLPGVYFDHKGLIEVDRPAIAAMCRGYASFLRAYKTLDVRLSANAPQFLDKLCWHIKTQRHVLLQTWHGTEPMSIYITNRQLIREFTRNFEAAWLREPPVARETVIQCFDSWGQS